ncbi:succinate dehydrogenase, cytochrome b556 subunit [Halomonas shantousis]
MNSKRPVNLDLSTIRFPLSALTSITHRVTGIILFIGLIFGFWALDASLSSPEGFEAVRDTLDHNFLAKLIAWGLLSALGFHFAAGIKHLLMDVNIGLDLKGSEQKTQITVIVSVILVILSGVWVW